MDRSCGPGAELLSAVTLAPLSKVLRSDDVRDSVEELTSGIASPYKRLERHVSLDSRAHNNPVQLSMQISCKEDLFISCKGNGIKDVRLPCLESSCMP